MEPNVILAESCCEINGFKADPWGPLEAAWGPLKALGSIYIEPKAHFLFTVASKSMVLGEPLESSGSIGEHSHGIQSLFLHTAVAKFNGFKGPRRFQECVKRDFGSQFSRKHFLGGSLGALEAPLGPLEALGSTDMEPKAHFGRQLQRNQWFQRRPWG